MQVSINELNIIIIITLVNELYLLQVVLLQVQSLKATSDCTA